MLTKMERTVLCDPQEIAFCTKMFWLGVWGEAVFVQCLMGMSIVGMFVVQEKEES